MDEFTQAVFDAAYGSRPQRNLRLLYGALLILKHTLRGFAFSWPLYLLSAAGLVLPGQFAWVFLLLLIPAVVLSGYILAKGLREDYRAVVRGRLLKPGDVRRALFGEGR
ncbi:MAG: hypothetical protein IV108_05820 [Burkholderiales bacterium]|nr:hypothetical protein [Burkholderiales bacterium]